MFNRNLFIQTCITKFSKIQVFFLITVLGINVYLIGCSGQDEEKGVGPVKEVTLASIDASLVEKGKSIFDSKCSACHKINEKSVGPALKDVTKRRKPEWIMNMILNPEQMTKENRIAQQLLAEYMTQMTFQNVSEADARALLEYFRSNDQ